ncbi:MAG: aminotransferase class III-fold pyridoxal phosphate-dependent enzyme [Clostridia bacterium]|nr:aminotransferase class III-fold pyridoxal phosphate-dependent enzyme [Clostridia bacterium]
MNIIEKDKQYVASTYNRFPVVLKNGKGSLVCDENGNRYIDLGTGIAVSTFGVSDDVWAIAVSRQASALSHTSNLYYHEPCAELAEMLCKRTGFKKVFFSNSGAEANECAIKAARRYAQDKKGQGCFKIITLENSFHGRTITTLSATGQEKFHKMFTPLTEGFEYVAPGDTESLEMLISRGDVAAVMFELVQGEGGVVPLEKIFVEKIVDLCKKHDVLIVCDEVQTGNGRTGKLYCYENYGFMPDIVSTAKGLAGGLPLGATLLGDKVKDVFAYGDHGSTFGANPVCCAGALSVLSRIDQALLDGVKERETIIRKTLKDAKGINGVYGMGLMLGIDVDCGGPKLASELLKKGVLALTAKNRLRLLPALNIPKELLSEALEIIKETAAELC